MHQREGLLSVGELRSAVDTGSVHTVLLVLVDMQGRLQGKRCAAKYFLEEVLAHGAEACNYLLAVDVEMNTVDGYALTSWESGYGDFELVPDLTTLRRLPWQPGCALVFADLRLLSGEPVGPSPRQILGRQRERLAERGWHAVAGTELEFIVYNDSYEEAWRAGYRGLTPANQYNVDYSILGTTRVAPLLDAITAGMTGAGLYVESAKGECNLGQQEIAFRYDEVLVTADNHALYKNGAKEIAAQQGCSLTFMAKVDAREGNSCHMHLSLRDATGTPVLAGPDGGMSPVGEHFLAGQLAALREFALLFAPNVNSYKRYAPGSFAPTAIAWGRDNRTCALRLVGRGPSLRVENRVPGGDVNPHLGLAAVIAGGLHGIERELPLPEPCAGNAYAADYAGRSQVPTTLRQALAEWESSELAKECFGEDVVEHYATMARVELAAFDAAVTDWERVRGFERM